MFAVFFTFQCFPHAVYANNHINVGVYQNKPLVFIDGEGKVLGIYADILNYIADKEGWDIDYHPCPWKQCLEQLEDGTLDIMVAIAYSVEREKRFDFNRETIFSNWGGIYIQPDSAIQSIIAMDDRKIAYIEEDIYYEGFQSHIRGFGITPVFIEADGYKEVLEMIHNRTVDAGIVSRLYGALHEKDYDVLRSNIIFMPTELRFALTKGINHKIISKIDYHLKQLKSDRKSVYFQTLNKWVEGQKEWAFPSWLKWVIASGGGLLVLVFTANMLLRSRIRSKTSELADRNRELEAEIAVRKRAEEELRFRKTLLESQNDASIDGVLVVDENGKIILYNKRFVEMWGIPDEIIRMRSDEAALNAVIEKFENPEDFMAKVKYLYEHIDEKSRDEVVLKDGRCFERYSSPVKSPEGTYYGRVWIFHEITERRKLEGELRHIQKMEAIGTLAGGIAHDFNNILNVIIGYADITQRIMRNDDPLRTNMQEILTASERAAHLTHSLLAFSRKQIMSLKPVNINDIVNGIKRMLSRIIGEDIELNVMLAERDMTVMADYGQIEQVLINLAANARDAMPEGGQFTIKTESVEVDENFIMMHRFGKTGTYACISVTDTGIGMDREVREKAFEPFFTTKEMGQGTGLGLSIVYGIIKQHYGYIDCYSEPGKGTTFRVFLPLTESDEEITELPEASPPRGGTETVLVAEDDMQVRELTGKILEEFGYTVIEAVDAGDAMEKFLNNKDRISLVVIDVIMPGKSGKELYEELQRIEPDVKALFMSGYSAEIIHKKKILDEKLNFMTKPFSSDAFLRKIREILDG